MASEPLIPTLIGDERDFEYAWRMFLWMQATDWRFLPEAGGLANQDEVLFENLLAIKVAVSKIKGVQNNAR